MEDILYVIGIVFFACISLAVIIKTSSSNPPVMKDKKKDTVTLEIDRATVNYLKEILEN